MTGLLDEPDARLRARFDAAVPPVPLDPAAVLQRARRRRRARVAGRTVAALALVGAVALGARTLGPTPVPPADAVDSSPGLGLWLSAEHVPPGAEVVGVLLDETGQGPVFDQLAVVERWTGAGWSEDERPLLWCLPGDGCAATVLPPHTAVDFQPVDIAPSPTAPGPAMRMSTAGLAPGWYQISHTSRTGSVAAGLLEITDDAPQPPPLPALDDVSLDVRPPVLTEGGGGTLAVVPVAPDGGLVPSLAASVAVEVWRDGGWSVVAPALALTGDGDGGEVVLPDLGPGRYRLVQATPTDGAVEGPFWVLPRGAPAAG